MRTRRPATLILTAILLTVPSIVSAASGLQGPVENGDFETGTTPRAVHEALSDSPVDECTGVGHQVFYGPSSLAGQATGGQAGEPNASKADPSAAAQDAADDPVDHAVFLSGYGHCVFEPNDRGVDVAWVNPVDQFNKPILWSVHPGFPSTEFGYDLDDDPFDREARFIADADLHNLNMWQSYVSQPGVYTANFDAFEMTVEAGDIPNSAKVQVILSASPLEAQSPYTVGYLDCVLTFDSANLAPGTDGRVSVDPLEGSFRYDHGDNDPICTEAAATINSDSATEEEKRDALGRLRIVQLNFRNFNTGSQAVVVDDVAMPGATTVAEEIAEGNHKVDPHASPEDL